MTASDIHNLPHQVLLADLIENILRHSDNPGACARQVTAQIRELIGVRLVAVVSEEATGPALVGICPARRKAEWMRPELQAFISIVSKLNEPRMVQPSADGGGAALRSLDMAASFVIPLMVGSERVGMLILLDLMDQRGASGILNTLIRVAPILALILKNSLLYNNLEKTVEIRTAQLARSENLFRSLFEQATDGIFFLDMQGHILAVNESFARLHGYTVPEMLKLGLDKLDVEGTTPFPERIRRIMTGGHLTFEVEHIHKNGEILPLEVAANRISTGSEELIIAVHRDIRERRQLEAEKAALATEKLQLQKMESLNRMAGAIAHHFNNQLQAVMGNLEMAMDDLPEGAAIPDTLAEALKAAGKAAEMSRLMLTYLGQTSGRHALLDLSEVCRQCLPLLQATAPNGVILKADFPVSGPPVRGNTGQLQQMLTHLITNAWEASGSDAAAIHLTLKTVLRGEIPKAGRFPVDWQAQERKYACIEVTDSGSGIAETDIAKLFDPFFTSKSPGRGMGLPIVLGIMRAHGGGITVESRPGRGTRFRIFLPTSSDGPGTSCGDAVSPTGIEGSGTVLLIEDEPHIRHMARIMLTRLGYTVIEARDGAEAVEIFSRNRKEIRWVLSDLTMPRMNGWEMLNAIRRLSPDIPVILTSGYDEAHVMAGDHPERPNAFLGKPYLIQELRDAIRRILAPS